MPFPASFIDELVQRNPIEEVVGQYVSLTRRGSNLFGLCPFHSEKTPSFSVAPEKGIYYCFGCHKGGGVINFIMEEEALDYPDAVRFLAKRAGLTVPEDESHASTYRRQQRLWALCREAARYFHTCLNEPAGEGARAYIERRGLSRATVTRFGLGYAPEGWSSLIDAMGKLGYDKQELLDAGLAVKSSKGTGSIYDRFRNRLMFPIIDLRGNVIGFGGRVMDASEPKYLNSPETIIFNKRKNLFALNVARKSKQGYLILTEGYMDAISLHQYGFDCAVASLGTSLTQEHARLLSAHTQKVVLTYDADAAGQNATQRAISMLEQTGVQVRVLRMQGAKDPDEFLKKFGADRFRLLLERSENHIEYRLLSLRNQYDLQQDDQRVAFLKAAAELVAALPGAVEREIYGARCAEAAGISADAMKLEVERAARRLQAREKKQREREQLQPVRQAQPKARGIHYDNVKSAMAEERLLAMLLMQPALFEKASGLAGGMFSSPLLGRAYDALHNLYLQNLTPSLSLIGESFSAEEIAHLSGVAEKLVPPVSEAAFADCLNTLRQQFARAQTQDHPDLMALREQYQKNKGYGGKHE